jgi:hypothetical protein
MYQNNWGLNSSIDSSLNNIKLQLSKLRSNGFTIESENVELSSSLDKIVRDLKDVQYGSPAE